MQERRAWKEEGTGRIDEEGGAEERVTGKGKVTGNVGSGWKKKG